MKLKNKVVVITGGSQGLGEVLSYKLSDQGASVVILARREMFLRKVIDKIKKDNKKAYYFVCDIRDPEQIKTVLGKIRDKFKKVDILINNAGVWTDDELDKVKPENRLNVFSTNVLGHIQFTEQAIPVLNKKESIIFNTISTAGVAEIPSGNNILWKTYGASKWGLVGYTNALRESLRETNIKVMQYFPGGFESNLYENAGRGNPHNQPWMMKTGDVADIVVFALTRPSDVYMEKIVVSKKMPSK